MKGRDGMNDAWTRLAAKLPVLLRRADQVCCACLLTVGLVLLIGTWVYQGGLQGRLIDIDRADRQTVAFQLDMNEADWPEWALLPGIGETLAQRILESRERDGPFRSVEDLRRVRGIGPQTLEQIRPYLLAPP
jgi:competence protein ComEA